MFDIGLGQLGSIPASAIYFSTQKYEAAPAIPVAGQDPYHSIPGFPGQLLWERLDFWYSTWNPDYWG